LLSERRRREPGGRESEVFPGNRIEQLRRAGSALTAVLLLTCCAPVDVDDGGTASSEPGDMPPALLENVVFEGYAAGSREVAVQARAAEVNADERSVELQGVRISLDDEQRGSVEIQAESALFDLEADDFLLRDRVEGTTARGEHFVTAEVSYEQASQRLFTDHPVVVHRPDMTLRGDGMELDLETRTLKITGNVRTQVEPR
jgi:LPS export ABC transporter protein LptC